MYNLRFSKLKKTKFDSVWEWMYKLLCGKCCTAHSFLCYLTYLIMNNLEMWCFQSHWAWVYSFLFIFCPFKAKHVRWTSKSVWRILVAMEQPARTLWAATAAAANPVLLDATARPTSMTANPVSQLIPHLMLMLLRWRFKPRSALLIGTILPSDPCSNGGLCKDEVNSFLCTCLPGFQGQRCEEDINECESNPCKNGANCTDCVNSYTCTCPAGFSGIHCENNTPDCTER